MVERQNLLLVIVGVSMVNGIFSPYLKVSLAIAAALLPELFPRTIEWVLFWNSILLSSATLVFSGVPAALYERFFERETVASAWIWLAGAALLTLPALGRAL
jgi:hypothetical protein